jgi:hypothetical protein
VIFLFLKEGKRTDRQTDRNKAEKRRQGQKKIKRRRKT